MKSRYNSKTKQLVCFLLIYLLLRDVRKMYDVNQKKFVFTFSYLNMYFYMLYDDYIFYCSNEYKFFGK